MDRLLKVSDVAAILNLSEDRIYSLAREKIIPCCRLGRTLRFSAARIEEFIVNGGKALPGIYKRKP